jgi:hypothetical protein
MNRDDRTAFELFIVDLEAWYRCMMALIADAKLAGNWHY